MINIYWYRFWYALLYVQSCEICGGHFRRSDLKNFVLSERGTYGIHAQGYGSAQAPRHRLVGTIMPGTMLAWQQWAQCRRRLGRTGRCRYSLGRTKPGPWHTSVWRTRCRRSRRKWRRGTGTSAGLSRRSMAHLGQAGKHVQRRWFTLSTGWESQTHPSCGSSWSQRQSTMAWWTSTTCTWST